MVAGRARAEVAGASVPDADGARDRAADAVVAARPAVVDLGPQRQRRSLLLKLMRVPPTGHRHVHSPEEIELLIAESRDGGLLEPQEQVRLHRALRLGLRTARAADGAARSARRHRRGRRRSRKCCASSTASPFSRLPVYRGSLDNIIGILHTKDVVTDFIRERPRESLRALLQADRQGASTRCPPTGCWRSCASAAAIRRWSVDAAGSVVGLITLEDVLAELLGGVSDEFKTTQIARDADV